MNIVEYSTSEQLQQYTAWLASTDPTNLWQSVEWQNYSQAKGEQVRIFTALDNDQIVASALCTISTTTGGFSTWSIPRGPVWQDDQAVAALLEHIVQVAKASKCIQLYISPNSRFQILDSRFKPSNRLVFPEASTIVDCSKNIEEIMKNAKPKARYNNNVAQKHDVTIQSSTDATAFAELHAKTANRNGFTKPQTSHYQTFLDSLSESFLLYAYAPGTTEPIAGLIGVIQGTTGIYYYGASDYEYRKLMAPYALQWAAIEHCKEQGALKYDLFGIAPEHSTNHAWEGITSFKTKFGGQYTEYPVEQTIVLRPLVTLALKLKRKLF